MEYFHSTTQKNAMKIVASQSLKKSKFDAFDFIDKVIERNLHLDDQSSIEIPSKMGKSYVYTLGEGYYFYNKIESAKKHLNNGTVVVAKLEEDVLFELHKKTDEILTFLDEVFREYIEEQFKSDEKYLKVYQHLLDIFEIAIYDKFIESPHVAALVIDTYRYFDDFKEYNLFSNRVPKCYDFSKQVFIEEYVVKDKKIIKSLKLCV